MPISVNVSINGRDITAVHIGRISDSIRRDQGAVYQYAVVERPEVPQSDEEWEQGRTFEHAYGDGLMTCISKALRTLDLKPEQMIETH